MSGLRTRLGSFLFPSRGVRHVTPDELAAIGRPGMLRASLQRASLMRPAFEDEVTRLAETVTPCDDEARFWATKIVWKRRYEEEARRIEVWTTEAYEAARAKR